MMEKRVHPRLSPLVIKTAYTAGGQGGEGYLTNVSEGGAFLAVDHPPPIGSEVEIRAVLPWRLGELRAVARVAWRSPGGGEGRARLSGAGLAFASMDAQSRKHLDAYLKKFSELASRIEDRQGAREG
jgi:Tfp pilus assembly protein PilZ